MIINLIYIYRLTHGCDFTTKAGLDESSGRGYVMCKNNFLIDGLTYTYNDKGMVESVSEKYEDGTDRLRFVHYVYY